MHMFNKGLQSINKAASFLNLHMLRTGPFSPAGSLYIHPLHGFTST